MLIEVAINVRIANQKPLSILDFQLIKNELSPLAKFLSERFKEILTWVKAPVSNFIACIDINFIKGDLRPI